MNDINNLDFLAGRPHRDAGHLINAHELLQVPHADPQTGEATVHHGTPHAIVAEQPEYAVELAGRMADAFTMFLVASSPSNLNYGPVSAWGFDGLRKRALVSNTSPNTAICFGKRSQVAAGLGFLIPSGAIIETFTQEEMYIGLPIGYTGITVPVGIYIERMS